MMKKLGILVFSGALMLSAGTACGNGGGHEGEAMKAGPDGKALFETHCNACHKDGGNIINPQKTLSKADLKASGIASADDIVRQMRNPSGTGMPPVSMETLSDEEAKAVAEYILKTF